MGSRFARNAPHHILNFPGHHKSRARAPRDASKPIRVLQRRRFVQVARIAPRRHQWQHGIIPDSRPKSENHPTCKKPYRTAFDALKSSKFAHTSPRRPNFLMRSSRPTSGVTEGRAHLRTPGQPARATPATPLAGRRVSTTWQAPVPLDPNQCIALLAS